MAAKAELSPAAIWTEDAEAVGAGMVLVECSVIVSVDVLVWGDDMGGTGWVVIYVR